MEAIRYVRISEGQLLPPLNDLRPFRTVVVLNSSYSEDWQFEVSDWLVAEGCMYMMAWGPDSTKWDDSVDYAVRKANPGDETPDDKFVMTTWHPEETLEDVFWYCQFCAGVSYNDVALDRTVILDISNEDREAELLALFERSKSLAEREDAEGD